MPKVIDHDQRRGDIIDVTWGLIVRGGIEAATMREIASGAGFANGALKHYFPGKDDIIQGTYERSFSRMSEIVVQAVRGKHGVDALRAVCWATMPLDEEAVTAARVLLAFWERAASNEDLHDAYLEHHGAWRSGLAIYIAEGRAAGDITTETPDDQLVDEIVLINVGANLMCLIAPQQSTAELRVRHLESFFQRLSQK